MTGARYDTVTKLSFSSISGVALVDDIAQSKSVSLTGTSGNGGDSSSSAAVASSSLQNGTRQVSSSIGSQQDTTNASVNVLKPKRSPAKPIDKYWLRPTPPPDIEDVVVIHVCDESRHSSKDFCCKRDILVKHMKYFDRFLTENENGYDDIDISVHCDIDIFEWLMAFIHEPNEPPLLDKAIVVSILISSEFLQMDSLVEICLEHICHNLNDIIKLPIDLSCISERLVNKLALMTQPMVRHF